LARWSHTGHKSTDNQLTTSGNRRDAGTMTDEINDAAKDIVAVFMHPADLGFEDVLQATRSRISKVVGILPTTHNPEETTL
jgi:hypothetical protein